MVHGKGSLLGKMPGDAWQKFANLRAYFGFMYGHPGKKLLFMGCEFGQGREWNHDTSLDWHQLDDPLHKGVQLLVRDLNHLYRELPALHERDCEPDGFEWLELHDNEQSVLAFLRRGADPSRIVVVACNFTPVPRYGYRIGVPLPGWYRERRQQRCRDLRRRQHRQRRRRDGRGPLARTAARYSLSLTLPPLATVFLELGG